MVSVETEPATENETLRGGPAAASIVAMYRPAGSRIKTMGLAQSILADMEPSARETVTTPLPRLRESSPVIRKRIARLIPGPNVDGRMQETICRCRFEVTPAWQWQLKTQTSAKDQAADRHRLVCVR